MAASRDPMAREDVERRRRLVALSAAVPQVGAIGKGGFSRWPTKANTENAADLIGKIQRGDIVMTTNPWGYSMGGNAKKFLAALGMGNAQGYHAVVVESVDNSKGTMTILELAPENGYQRRTINIKELKLATVYRHKRAVTGERVIKNMANYVKFFDDLEKKLQARGIPAAEIKKIRTSTYHHEKLVTTAAAEIFFPQVTTFKRTRSPSLEKRVANIDKIADSLEAMWKVEGKIPKNVPFIRSLGGICTTALNNSGMPVSHKALQGTIGPNDVMRSPGLKRIFSHASKSGGKTMRPLEWGFRVAPTAIRAAGGVGVAAGVSSIVKRWQSRKYKYIRKYRNEKGQWVYVYNRGH